MKRSRVCFPSSTDVERSFRTRFSNYWSAIMDNNFEKSFSFEAPYIKEMVLYNRYKMVMRVKNKGLYKMDVKDCRCERVFYCCCVFDAFYFNKENGVRKKAEIKDCWVKVNNNWWHVIMDPLFFPELQ